METVERDFAKKGVKFYYIYKALAHPETNGYVTPFTLKERLLHVAEAKKKLGSRISWLCDSMSNDLKHALGNAPNSEFIVDPQGMIVSARNWSRPQELRDDLTELLGAVERPTTLADIGMKPLAPPKTAARGVVPRIQLPGRMTPIRIEPMPGNDPFYAKLRAEIDSSYMSNREGKLYLGFFLDPLYQVHWNNQVDAIRYEIKVPDGITVTPAKGKGPTINEKADADPREFLVKISGRSRQPLELTVYYFACDDAETFCKPITQHYRISLERDSDGGSRRSAGGRGRIGRFANRRPPRRRTSSNDNSLQSAVQLFRKHDSDRDGKLSNKEAKALKLTAKADANGDKSISLRELVDWIRKTRGGR